LIYHGPLKPLGKTLLQSPSCPGAFLPAISTTMSTGTPLWAASAWRKLCKTPWGQKFAAYGDGKVVMPGMEPKTVVQAAVGLTTVAVVLGGLAWAHILMPALARCARAGGSQQAKRIYTGMPITPGNGHFSGLTVSSNPCGSRLRIAHIILVWCLVVSLFNKVETAK
jgi:hypothetical protein